MNFYNGCKLSASFFQSAMNEYYRNSWYALDRAHKNAKCQNANAIGWQMNSHSKQFSATCYLSVASHAALHMHEMDCTSCASVLAWRCGTTVTHQHYTNFQWCRTNGATAKFKLLSKSKVERCTPHVPHRPEYSGVKVFRKL